MSTSPPLALFSACGLHKRRMPSCSQLIAHQGARPLGTTTYGATVMLIVYRFATHLVASRPSSHAHPRPPPTECSGRNWHGQYASLAALSPTSFPPLPPVPALALASRACSSVLASPILREMMMMMMMSMFPSVLVLSHLEACCPYVMPSQTGVSYSRVVDAMMTPSLIVPKLLILVRRPYGLVIPHLYPISTPS